MKKYYDSYKTMAPRKSSPKRSPRKKAKSSPRRKMSPRPRRSMSGMKSLQAVEKQARAHALKSSQCMRRARAAEMEALRAAKRVAKLPRGSAQRRASAKSVRSNLMKARRASECVTRELDASRRYAAKAAAARRRMRDRVLKGLDASLRRAKKAVKSPARRR